MAEVVEAPAEPKAEPAPVVEPVVEAPKPEPKYTQDDMDRITAKVKKNAAYRARKEAEAYYKGLQQGTGLGKPVDQPQNVQEPQEPKREAFDSYEAFLEAKAKHVATAATKEATEKAQKEASEKTAKEAEVKRAQEFQSKVRSQYPDIDSKLEEIGDLPIHKGVQEAIAESEFGPAILNDLVSKPDEFERLFKLSETAAIREIGKMEARFEAAKKPSEPAKKPSAAPAPIKPGGGGNPDDGKPSDNDSMDDWMRKSHAQDRKKLSAR